ncbi:SDR family NAD(P)-dependent oxidoreductase [Sphingobacterium corticibacterium]|uniref:SDR family oxidoreductase n=1 Tax=Sphingobacterium corticibacterium TaxID=2484746 RepID=A0A4Q6XNH1_9SPHI|nr:SDR family oxidoreductase [Sphingobacterium corticibacterium]RZF58882.1 SDR family oxidoreductase [Sphingobacterium corticibacterium]
MLEVESKKNILVTGATSGIGKGLVISLLQDPENIVYGIGRDEEKISGLLDKQNFKFIAYDLTDINSIENMFRDKFENVKFDGFVHCAGMEETIPITLYSPEKVLQIFQINVFSAIELLRLLSKKKYSENNASFVLLSSVMGELGQAGKVGYCASKAALLGVVKSLALELAKREIRVNAVSPGIVNTPLTSQLFQQLDAKNVDRIKDMHPMGIGKVDDVADLLCFLLSEKARWITGQNLKIDGGYSVQ